jgi:5,6,7,8-tetrahydromethanopterin hydro-lyase
MAGRRPVGASEARSEAKPSGVIAASEARSEPQANGVMAASEARSEPKANGVMAASEARSEAKPSGVIEIGEAFAGEGAEAAHLNTVLGPRAGPLGGAWATALATPSTGHAPFVAVVRPGLPAKPFTLFVNKAPIASERHARLTWGAAQAGVAGGVMDAVAAGAIAPGEVDGLLLIAAVWVDPAARDAQAVYRNNREATRVALAAGHRGLPAVEDVLAARLSPSNPFFEPA